MNIPPLSKHNGNLMPIRLFRMPYYTMFQKDELLRNPIWGKKHILPINSTWMPTPRDSTQLNYYIFLETGVLQSIVSLVLR